ncbi:MAG: tetratricopeptide repeat protein [Candidatus Adiutrix sp.]|jgi:Tfp pilus assembly protein PilF|nr:tetratricopeptide repeat protein [Candidatus Adiutrix sp.]
MMMFKRLLSLGLLAAAALALPACLPFLESNSKTKPAASGRPSESEQTKAQTSLAKALMMEGNYAQALPELLEAKKTAPKNADVENLIGLAHYGLKEYEEAIESFHKALQLNPGLTAAHNSLGLTYLALQNYDQALTEFNSCLKDQSYQNKHLPLSNIGLTYLETQSYDQALTALTRAIELKPDYDKTYQLIGRVYLAKNQTKEAVDYLTKAAELNPQDGDTRQLLAEAQARRSRL